MAEAVRVEREIAAPADQVWSMVSDVTRMGEWSPETTSCRWTKGATGPAVGARFVGNNQIGKRRWFTSCKVVEATPGESFAFQVTSGPLKVATWSYRFEPTDTGCRVSEEFVDERGWLAHNGGRLLTGVSDRPNHNREGMETTLANLAKVAEAT